MQWFTDYYGREIRLTDERLYGHIGYEHPMLLGIEGAIPETLAAPDFTRIDADDDEVEIYYKQFTNTNYGNLWVVVAVAFKRDEAFVVTAFTTRRRPRFRG